MKPISPEGRFQPVGDSAVRVSFGTEISPQTGRAVRRFCRALDAQRPHGINEWVPGYAAITVYYRPWEVDYDGLCAALTPLLARRSPETRGAGRLVQIPVCYGGEHGPDLAEVAARHGLAPAQVVRRHAARRYPVYFLGFLPGFAYLGGLSPALETPRRDRPRPAVPAGSVGIAGAQTGVYPIASPGGWQIIGRTPLRLYDLARQPPALLAAGDHVQFVPITERRFEELSHEAH